jgi:hypothetical protein
MKFLQSLLQAMHESRSEQAAREMAQFRHLIPTDAVKPDGNGKAGTEVRGKFPQHRPHRVCPHPQAASREVQLTTTYVTAVGAGTPPPPR